MSISETPAHRSALRKYIMERDNNAASSASSSARPPQEIQTPQSKYGASVLISATATRINGRIAITPTTRDVTPSTLTSKEMRRTAITETPSKSTTIVKSAYTGYGRRLPMNMVVSQVASRRPTSPVRELKERYLVSEPPPLDPLLDQLLNFKTPGAKTGSLPHPDDLMGGRLRKYRRMEGPEDDIHKAFISIYGSAEASLSVSKKLRLTKNNEHNDDSLAEEFHDEHNLSYEQFVATKSCLLDDVIPRDNVSPVLDSDPHYLELYGGSAQTSYTAVAMRKTPADPVDEIWKSLEASPPPRKFVTSHNFLKTASEVSKENNFVPQQESTWTKYLNNAEKTENKNPWGIESLGNTSHQHYSGRNPLHNIKSSYLKQEFNFILCSPDKPDVISPSLGQSCSRVRRREGGSTGMPESAECRWLYETETTSRSRHDSDDDEVSALLLQSEKESIFSTSSEGKETYNYSSDE